MLPLTLEAAPVKRVGEAEAVLELEPVAEAEVVMAEEEPLAEEVAEVEPVGVAEDPELLTLEVSEEEAEEVEEDSVVEEAPPTEGTEIGWPAEEHCCTTALETEDWSATPQAFCTQGVMVLTSEVFWQWQAKSVRLEHPSEVKAVTKQFKEH
jgi:hypothetical protein